MKWIKRLTVLMLVMAIGIFAVAMVQEYKNNDETMPEIVLSSDTLEIPCAYSEEMLKEGVTASDAKDGDLTGQVIIGNFTRFIEHGTSSLSYFVFDEDEHMATAERKVHFTDYYSPRFHLGSPLVFLPSETSITAIREMFTAEDPLDGDLTQWISYEGSNAILNTPGSYTISMEVRNSFGDTVTYDFPIHVLEENGKGIQFSFTEPVVYIPSGSAIDALSYVTGITDSFGNPVDMSLIRTTSYVDTAIPGIYEICYEADNGAGLYGQSWLTVIVEEAR